jgi:hypothetical protein
LFRSFLSSRFTITTTTILHYYYLLVSTIDRAITTHTHLAIRYIDYNLFMTTRVVIQTPKRRKMGFDVDFPDDGSYPMDGVELDSSTSTSPGVSSLFRMGNQASASDQQQQQNSSSQTTNNNATSQPVGAIKRFGDLFDDDDLD